MGINMNDKYVPPVGITKIKIDKCFRIVREFVEDTAIARALLGSKTPTTLNGWINKGGEILNTYDDLSSNITDAYLETLDEVDELIEMDRATMVQDYLEEINESEITPKNRYGLEARIVEAKIQLLETISKQKEEQLVDEYNFDIEHPIELDNTIKYIKFNRAYTRAKNSNTNNWLKNINKHAGNVKNAQSNFKMLEITEEGFQPKKAVSEVTHKGTLNLADIARIGLHTSNDNETK